MAYPKFYSGLSFADLATYQQYPFVVFYYMQQTHSYSLREVNTQFVIDRSGFNYHSYLGTSNAIDPYDPVQNGLMGLFFTADKYVQLPSVVIYDHFRLAFSM